MQLSFKPKHTPYDHQSRCLALHGEMPAFALTAEMGTGKTWIIIHNAIELWRQNQCDAILVMAPNGVHENWTRIELPKHMPKIAKWKAATWYTTTNATEKKELDEICQPDPALRILTMNWEALATARGHAHAVRFVQSAKNCMIVADESDCIKNPSAQRTKAMMKLRWLSRWRRIVSGTVSDGTPFALFSQYGFLDPTILGTTS